MTFRGEDFSTGTTGNFQSELTIYIHSWEIDAGRAVPPGRMTSYLRKAVSSKSREKRDRPRQDSELCPLGTLVNQVVIAPSVTSDAVETSRLAEFS